MNLKFRKATSNDVQLYFNWANDVLVRNNSFNQATIDMDKHITWFNSKLKDDSCFFYLFLNNLDSPVGQVRIEKKTDEAIIGISIDENYRGKGLGSDMLNMACKDYFKHYPDSKISAYIKEGNEASIKLFTKAKFDKIESLKVAGHNSFKFQKLANEHN